MRQRLITAICLFIWAICSTGCTASARIYDSPVDNIGRSPETTGSVSSREETRNKSEIHTKSLYLAEAEEETDLMSLFRETDIQNFDIPIVFNDAVEYYIKYFMQEKRKVFGNWLRRSRQYVPLITEILRKQNMPEDLVYLAMIESGFNPKAYSHAKASGPWQFIQETGARYGLKVNRWVDERRDPEKSTVAAAKYLRDLFSQFGCWYLAAAGYNAGENRVVRAIKEHNTVDFWEIYKYNALPRETRNYIPQLIAAAIIAKEPGKYGFDSLTYDAPARLVKMSVPPSTPLPLVAKASSIDLDRLKTYNPELLGNITPPGKDHYEIKLPGSIDKQQFAVALKSGLTNTHKTGSIATYKIRQNDTLAKIAKKYGVRTTDIRLANNWKKTPVLRTGMTIAMPGFVDGTEMAETIVLEANNIGQLRQKIEPDPARPNTTAETTTNTASINKAIPGRSHHTVRKGDSLASISDRYGIGIGDLKSINRLKNDKLVPNAKSKLVSYSAKKERQKVIYHTVQKGESLSSLSNKYSASIDKIRSINKLKHDNIHVGMKLKIMLKKGSNG